MRTWLLSAGRSSRPDPRDPSPTGADLADAFHARSQRRRVALEARLDAEVVAGLLGGGDGSDAIDHDGRALAGQGRQREHALRSGPDVADVALVDL
jgi:hypothetical protein